MDPDMEVMDDHAVKWGQESWGSWFGSSNATLHSFAVREKGLSFQNKTTTTKSLISLETWTSLGLIWYFIFN